MSFASMAAVDMTPYLEPTYHINSDALEIQQFVDDVAADATDPTERAILLFRAVRDGIRYNPHTFTYDTDAYKASTTLANRTGFCVPKAILLAAVTRAAGIPSRLAFADVVNHLATERLIEQMETDVFAFHGYNELYLNNKWVKATPTFDTGLCEKFGVKPLEFDGHNDSVFHAFDTGGRKHMEYILDRGHYADLPFDEMIRVYQEFYPNFIKTMAESTPHAES